MRVVPEQDIAKVVDGIGQVNMIVTVGVEHGFVGRTRCAGVLTLAEEEQLEHGLVGGVAVALKKTGSIIAGCGVIMAGTFSSLLAGSLVGMQQLGFALAFGVLLDTMVVMPILVPAWLILLYRGRLGPLSRRWNHSGPENVSGGAASEISGSEAERLPGDGGLSADR